MSTSRVAPKVVPIVPIGTTGGILATSICISLLPWKLPSPYAALLHANHEKQQGADSGLGKN